MRRLPMLAAPAAASNSCALIGDGTIRCWGDDTYGQLGHACPIVPQIYDGATGCGVDKAFCGFPVPVLRRP